MKPSITTSPIHILHLEDSLVDHDLVCRALKSAGMNFSIVRVDTLEAFLQQLKSAPVDVILADYRLSGFTAVDAWRAIQSLTLVPPLILVSGAIGESAAVEAIRLGFSDYVLKDGLSKLAHAIGRSIEVHQARVAKELAMQELAQSERRLADFSSRLQVVMEEERAAIAREIHDDIGGSLAAVNLELAWVGRHTSDVAVHEHLRSANDMLQHAMGASQRIMMDLRPAILDQGLAASVEWLASQFERRTGIKTHVKVAQTQGQVAKHMQLTAYRTTQEALTNISKHARCDVVTIDLSDTEGVLTLEITDNGQGVSDEDRAKDGSFGLKGLQERAKTVGGWLDVSSRAGVGTSIILSIPLVPEGAPDSEQLDD